MASELERILDQVGKDRGIDKKILIEALESAMLSAAKKRYGPQADIEARYNPELGEVELFEFKKVVEEVHNPAVEISLEEARATDPDIQVGDSLGQKISTEEFGRISAQTAKQVIVQKVRDAERENIYNQYIGQAGELVHGSVQRFERGDIIVNLGKAEAILPVMEQIPRESYAPGDRIRAYIYAVERNPKGPQIKLSRARPEMLTKLFELEVPEIYEGIVEIKAVAREPGGRSDKEPGGRSKIAVYSRDINVDPVGACVGMKGSRVQAIVNELRGEKIDIVPYSNDIATYVCNALAPAEVSKVIIDEKNHAIEVIVPDNQRSLAIGKKGQNVRLASKLVGWKIEIHSESEAEDSYREARARLEAIPGVGDVTARVLLNAGIYSPQDILDWDLDALAEVTQLGRKKAQKLKELAQEYLTRLETEPPEAGQARAEEIGPEGSDARSSETLEQGKAAQIDEGPPSPDAAAAPSTAEAPLPQQEEGGVVAPAETEADEGTTG